MRPISVKGNDRLLIIAPHPDDECIGVGGILARYPGQCEVLVLTDGSRGRTYHHTREEISQIRAQEFMAEMEWLGIKAYKMLGLEDGALFQSLDCLKDKDLSVYNKIFIPSREDGHSDHRAAFQALMRALKEQDIKNVEVYQYEVTIPVLGATHGLDIGGNMSDKLKLICFHESQTKQYDYCVLAERNNRDRAEQANVRYVEAYSYTEPGDGIYDSHTIALERQSQKQRHFTEVYDRWLELLLTGKDIAAYFAESGYREIAIYGYATMGKRLKQQIDSLSDVQVEFIIDRRAAKKNVSDVEIVEPSISMKKVDVIIVTALHDYRQVKLELNNMGYENVISFEDMIDTILRDY